MIQFCNSQFYENIVNLTKINQDSEIFNYFSYDYFYVLCCYFNELDSDEDGKISLRELEAHFRYSISLQILSRLLKEVRNGVFRDEEGINYREFCALVLLEEDKTFRNSILTWFSVIDFECDGIIEFNYKC